MQLPSPITDKASLLLIDGSLVLLACAATFAWPRMGTSWFARIERLFMRLARRKHLAVTTVGLTALLLRLALLPLFPIPLPFLPDDFSLLLASDTFAHGRLTNPTPAMWMHFESIHISMQPTYMSMYFPSLGLLMAAGKVLLGNPWYAILIANALMCAAICWMLQAWLPSGWALLGGLLAILRLGLFSYWINTYTGGGALLAFAGALVLGALPRLMKTARVRYGLLMALGIALLALTRPYEGLLLCLPVAAALGHWAVRGKNRPRPGVLLRRAMAPLALIAAALLWLGYYDYRAFGSPVTLPYTINRATYAMAPYFVWQHQRPEPVYRHNAMRRFYYESEMKVFNKVHTWRDFIPITLMKLATTTLFFAGYALLLPLIMLRRTLLDRRVRFLVLCIAVLMAGMLIEIYLIPHYLAPFTAAFYALGLQMMRHLRFWRPGDAPVGAALVRMSVVVCVALAALRVCATPLGLAVPEWPASNWSGMWYGPEHYGTERAGIEAELKAMPGKQIVLVRDAPKRDPLDQWVYNAADINASKVIWAQEMDAASNAQLMRHYPGRRVWLVDPNTEPAQVSSYEAPQQAAAAH